MAHVDTCDFKNQIEPHKWQIFDLRQPTREVIPA